METIEIIKRSITKLKGFVNTTPENHGKGTTTHTNGDHYDLFNVKLEDIKIERLAHSLSKQCRYNGHVGSQHINSDHGGFYSVAQHSVRMSEAGIIAFGSPRIALALLVHDGAEYFTGDVVRPLKYALKQESSGLITKIEDDIDGKIYDFFGVPEEIIPIIKKMDYNIAQDEMTFLLKHQNIEFDYWTPKKSYNMFMAQWQKLLVLMEYNDKEIVEQDING